MKLLVRLVIAALAAALVAVPEPAMAAQGQNFVIDDPMASPRTQWWTDAKFGQFIHWGVYSAFAGQYGTCRSAEWIKRNCSIPDADYAARAASWNPTSFDANAIVQLARDAGQKYIVITAKHHDGFAMWPTAVNDYNIADGTPFGRDPLRELADAARANGIRFGLYYSIWDWHDPDALPGGSYPAYLNRAKAQLQELITSYDPDVLWFDGTHKGYTNPPNPFTFADGEQLEWYVRGLKPSIIINERAIDHHGANRPADGDYTTPEGEYPTSPSAAELMETCDNVTGQWGYAAWDTTAKSPTTMTRHLIDLASIGSNYLVNIGPTDTGAIRPLQADQLRGMKSWMATNSTAIYGAGFSGLTNEPSWGKITRKGGKLYLHVYNWPGAGGTLHVSARSAFAMTAARVLGSGQAVTVRAAGDGFDVIPSGSEVSPVATVIEADISPPAAVAVGSGSGLKAEFWNNTTFTGTPAVTRTDATVNYAWRFSGSPAANVGADNFSARWTGSVQPRYSETYTFTTVSDDTVQLWVNGQLIISNTTPHSATVNQGSIALTAGQRYDIRLEHTENGGEAYAKLIWTSPNTLPQVVPASQLYSPGSPGSGPVRGIASGRCADIPGADPVDGKQLILWDCHTGANQAWTAPGDGTLRAMGKCMTATSAADGAAITISACNGSAGQQWAYNTTTQQLRANGKCLDASGAGTLNNTPLILYPCHTGTNQKWART